jgi:hypothetical protein
MRSEVMMTVAVAVTEQWSIAKAKDADAAALVGQNAGKLEAVETVFGWFQSAETLRQRSRAG